MIDLRSGDCLENMTRYTNTTVDAITTDPFRMVQHLVNEDTNGCSFMTLKN